jgi:GAG-pre-integrase domain
VNKATVRLDAVFVAKISLQLLHQQLRHINMERIKQLSNNIEENISFNQSKIKNFQCDICKLEKTHRRSIHNISMERAEWLGQFFHANVCGSIQVPSYGSL